MRGRKPSSPKVQDLRDGVLRVVDGGKSGGGDGGGPTPPKAKAEPPPDWVKGKIARAEWARVLPELKLRKQYIPLFATELGRYCMALQHYTDAVAQMNKRGQGPVVKSSKGTPMMSQYWIIASRAHEIMVKLAADLGLNPVSQVRMAGMQLDMFETAAGARTGTDDGPDGDGNPFGQFRR